jgi:hypothetical protein
MAEQKVEHLVNVLVHLLESAGLWARLWGWSALLGFGLCSLVSWLVVVGG